MKARREPKILIADDDPGTCETLGDIFAAQGYAVTTVEDGRAALAAVRREKYDAALIDQRMPVEEGLAVVEEIRKTGACDNIYVITAYADDGFVRRALASGARHVFVKPLDIPQLAQTLADDIGVQSRLGASRRLPGGVTPHMVGLTHRELQVLAMLAQGKHNREIAGELRLSTRTVERHVGDILSRLSVNSRSAAAALAIRHHLV